MEALAINCNHRIEAVSFSFKENKFIKFQIEFDVTWNVHMEDLEDGQKDNVGLRREIFIIKKKRGVSLMK